MILKCEEEKEADWLRDIRTSRMTQWCVPYISFLPQYPKLDAEEASNLAVPVLQTKKNHTHNTIKSTLSIRKVNKRAQKDRTVLADHLFIPPDTREKLVSPHPCQEKLSGESRFVLSRGCVNIPAEVVSETR